MKWNLKYCGMVIKKQNCNIGSGEWRGKCCLETSEVC